MAKKKSTPQSTADNEQASITPRDTVTDEEADVTEEFLETEAPGNDRRDRYSAEYKHLEDKLPEELKNVEIPDGQDTYSEEKDAMFARGENPKGSSQHESGVKTLGNPESRAKKP